VTEPGLLDQEKLADDAHVDKTDHQTTCHRFWETTLYYYQLNEMVWLCRQRVVKAGVFSTKEQVKITS